MRLLNAKLHFRVDLPGLYANCKLKKKVEQHKLKNLYELHDRHSSFQTVHCLHFASFNSCYWDSLIMIEIPLDKYGKKTHFMCSLQLQFWFHNFINKLPVHNFQRNGVLFGFDRSR